MTVRSVESLMLEIKTRDKDHWTSVSLLYNPDWERAEGFSILLQGGRELTKMPVIDVENLTDLDKAKMEVDQLKKEVKLEREKVSKCCEEVMEYIQSGMDDDPLVKGIPEEKNPFKEKGGCVIC